MPHFLVVAPRTVTSRRGTGGAVPIDRAGHVSQYGGSSRAILAVGPIDSPWGSRVNRQDATSPDTEEPIAFDGGANPYQGCSPEEPRAACRRVDHLLSLVGLLAVAYLVLAGVLLLLPLNPNRPTLNGPRQFDPERAWEHSAQGPELVVFAGLLLTLAVVIVALVLGIRWRLGANAQALGRAVDFRTGPAFWSLLFGGGLLIVLLELWAGWVPQAERVAWQSLSMAAALIWSVLVLGGMVMAVGRFADQLEQRNPLDLKNQQQSPVDTVVF